MQKPKSTTGKPIERRDAQAKRDGKSDLPPPSNFSVSPIEAGRCRKASQRLVHRNGRPEVEVGGAAGVGGVVKGVDGSTPNRDGRWRRNGRSHPNLATKGDGKGSGEGGHISRHRGGGGDHRAICLSNGYRGPCGQARDRNLRAGRSRGGRRGRCWRGSGCGCCSGCGCWCRGGRRGRCWCGRGCGCRGGRRGRCWCGRGCGCCRGRRGCSRRGCWRGSGCGNSERIP
jgi:hypothetical protein